MGTEAQAFRKKVLFEGSDVIREGMPVAYNYDTLENINGVDTAVAALPRSGTTAEGGQNEGKFMRVEKLSVANAKYFAGVACSESEGLSGPRWIDIYVPNGAMVNVYTDVDVTLGDEMNLEDGEITVTNAVAATCMPRVGTFMETVDRSGAGNAGLCLAKLEAVKGEQAGVEGAFIVTGAAPASAAGDLAIPIVVGGVTYWLNATDAAPAGP
jgi:hypothetical protein